MAFLLSAPIGWSSIIEKYINRYVKMKICANSRVFIGDYESISLYSDGWVKGNVAVAMMKDPAKKFYITETFGLEKFDLHLVVIQIVKCSPFTAEQKKHFRAMQKPLSQIERYL